MADWVRLGKNIGEKEVKLPFKLKKWGQNPGVAERKHVIIVHVPHIMRRMIYKPFPVNYDV